MKTVTLRAHESVRIGILRVTDSLIDNALDRARHPSDDPGEDLHFFRTTIKRLRAMLQLIRPAIGESAFGRENTWLKNCASRLAGSRDRAVAGETLKDLAESHTAIGPELLQSVQAPDAGTSSEKDHRSTRAQVAHDLEQARAGFHGLQIGDDGWAAIGPGLQRVYRQARRRMREAYAGPDAEAFHRWRIRVKHLFYQLNWLEPMWPDFFAKLLRRLHKLEERLGIDHDIAVLRGMLEEARCDSPDAVRLVTKAAARKSRRLRESSKTLGEKTFHAKPGKFASRCARHWKNWQEKE